MLHLLGLPAREELRVKGCLLAGQQLAEVCARPVRDFVQCGAVGGCPVLSSTTPIDPLRHRLQERTAVKVALYKMRCSDSPIARGGCSRA